MKSVHLIITGHVQGVGFRDWLTREAHHRHLRGWVRNVGENAVEAVIAGSARAVEECVQLCWKGPEHAHVANIKSLEVPPPDEIEFRRLNSSAVLDE